MQPIPYPNDQSTSERVFDLVAQQRTPQHHRDTPEICTSAGVHDWCNAINCDLCAARASAPSSGEIGDLRYPFLSHQLISEALVHSGHCDDLLIPPSAFHVGNNQGDLNTPRYLGQETFDTNKQNNTIFRPSIASGQSDQAIPSSELFPIFHRASDWSNSMSSHLTDYSAHSLVVARQVNLMPFSGLSYHSPPSSWLIPQEPSRNCRGANGKNSTDVISTSLPFENRHRATSTPVMNLQPSPYSYGDHSHHSSTTHRHTPYIH